jgi:hypothetical protein
MYAMSLVRTTLHIKYVYSRELPEDGDDTIGETQVLSVPSYSDAITSDASHHSL